MMRLSLWRLIAECSRNPQSVGFTNRKGKLRPELFSYRWGTFRREKRRVEFHGDMLRPRESTGLKRRLRLGGRAPPFMMGHPQPKNALVGVRTKRADQAALPITTYLREHLIYAQHIAIYNNRMLYASVPFRRSGWIRPAS